LRISINWDSPAHVQDRNTRSCGGALSLSAFPIPITATSAQTCSPGCCARPASVATNGNVSNKETDCCAQSDCSGVYLAAVLTRLGPPALMEVLAAVAAAAVMYVTGTLLVVGIASVPNPNLAG